MAGGDGDCRPAWPLEFWVLLWDLTDIPNCLVHRLRSSLLSIALLHQIVQDHVNIVISQCPIL